MWSFFKKKHNWRVYTTHHLYNSIYRYGVFKKKTILYHIHISKVFFPIKFRLGTLDKSIVTKQARNSGKSFKKSGCSLKSYAGIGYKRIFWATLQIYYMAMQLTRSISKFNCLLVNPNENSIALFVSGRVDRQISAIRFIDRHNTLILHVREIYNILHMQKTSRQINGRYLL